MENTLRICSLIRKIRKKKKISQFDMSEKLHISQSAYAKVERGETTLDVERLITISEILEVKLEQLLLESSLKSNTSIENMTKKESQELEDYKTKYIKALERELDLYRNLPIKRSTNE